MLRPRLNRAPTPQEIADHTGLTLFAVKHALALARVMRQ
ncbi:sigma-70 domain-containing protein [Pendulispora rubella]